MIHSLRRYQELKSQAKEYLNGNTPLPTRLHQAVIELGFLEEKDIPQHLRPAIQEIFDLCSTHADKGEKGTYLTSIEAMSYEGQRELERLIRRL